MRLCVRSLALASAVVWGGMLLLIALLNQFGIDYGTHVLDFATSIYPGYGGSTGIGSVVVVTLYGIADGAVFGALIGWLYNWFRRDAA